MLDNNLKYNFPKGNDDPFEKGDKSGNYFVYANAHSNLASNLEEFNLDILEKNIPMGYKTIMVCKRLVLITEGQIIQKWNEDIELLENTAFGKYLVTTNKPYKLFVKNWDSFQETTSIYNSTIEDEYPWSSSWNIISECIKKGIENSVKMKSEILISSIIKSHSWH